MSIEFLRRLPLFASLPEADLEQLYRQAEPLTLSPGEVLIEEGAPGDALFVLIDGQLQVTKRSGGHDVKVDTDCQARSSAKCPSSTIRRARPACAA